MTPDAHCLTINRGARMTLSRFAMPLVLSALSVAPLACSGSSEHADGTGKVVIDSLAANDPSRRTTPMAPEAKQMRAADDSQRVPSRRFIFVDRKYLGPGEPDRIEDGSYTLEDDGRVTTLLYRYSTAVIFEQVTLQDGKIIMQGPRPSYLRSDQLYEIRGTQLCAYNPEGDGYDCYGFSQQLSTGSLAEFQERLARPRRSR